MDFFLVTKIVLCRLLDNNLVIGVEDYLVEERLRCTEMDTNY